MLLGLEGFPGGELTDEGNHLGDRRLEKCLSALGSRRFRMAERAGGAQLIESTWNLHAAGTMEIRVVEGRLERDVRAARRFALDELRAEPQDHARFELAGVRDRLLVARRESRDLLARDAPPTAESQPEVGLVPVA